MFDSTSLSFMVTKAPPDPHRQRGLRERIEASGRNEPELARLSGLSQQTISKLKLGIMKETSHSGKKLDKVLTSLENSTLGRIEEGKAIIDQSRIPPTLDRIEISYQKKKDTGIQVRLTNERGDFFDWRIHGSQSVSAWRDLVSAVDDWLKAAEEQ